MSRRFLTRGRASKLGVTFLCISAIVLAFSTAAKRYEISLYANTPTLLWISLVISLLLIVTYISLVDKSRQLIIGCGLLLVFYTILYSIPGARGYHLYGRGNSDILTHIGYAKAVNDTLSWYPAIHIQMRFLYELGFSWEFIATILAVVFSFLFAFGVALYARSLQYEKHTWLMTLTASVIPFLGPFTRMNHPAIYSFMLLPLGLWLARKGKQEAELRYLLPTLVVSSAIIVFHPVSAALLLIGLVVDSIRSHSTTEKLGTLIPVYVGVVTVIWYMGFTRFAAIIGAVATPNIGGAATSSTTAILDPALTPLDVIRRGIEMYGAIAIVGTLGGIATIILFRENLQDEGEPSDGVLIGHYLTSVVFGASFLFIDLIVSAPIRAARYGVFASLLTLPNLMRPLAGRKRTIASVIVMVLLAASLTLSIGTIYEPNKHFTETEYDGATWQADYHSGSTPVYAHNMGKKMDFYLFGADPDRIVFASRPMPHQLGYSNNETVGEAVDGGYIVTKSFDLRFTDIFVEGKRSRQMVYSEEDLKRLTSDPEANSVYSNGGYSVWLV